MPNQHTEGNAGRDRSTKPRAVRFSADEMAKLEQLAKKHGMSANAWIAFRASTEGPAAAELRKRKNK